MTHKLGQVFLKDPNIINKIITCVRNIGVEHPWLEIGCGDGALTAPLASLLPNLDVVEVDKQCIEDTIKNLSEEEKEKVMIINKDILIHKLNKKTNIVTNLPYYLSAKWIKWVIAQRKSINKCIVMVQKEFGEKLFASPSQKVYTSLTLFSHYYLDIKKEFLVKKTCFSPVPKIDSIVLSITPREKPLYHIDDEDLFFSMIRSAFWGRRKPLLSALKKSPYIKIIKEISSCPFFEKNKLIRGETMSIDLFFELYEQIKSKVEKSERLT